MRQLSRFSTLLLAAALGLGAAGAAQAQSGLPPIQQQGTVSFVTGGVGLDESTALKQAAPQWPLELRFTGKHAEFIAGVKVTIANARGTLLQTVAQGPYLLVKLPEGAYTVKAEYNGNVETRTVTVSVPGAAKEAFTWEAAAS